MYFLNKDIFIYMYLEPTKTSILNINLLTIGPHTPRGKSPHRILAAGGRGGE